MDDNLRNNCNHYSSNELDFLKKNYMLMSHTEMGNILGRTINSVRNKCHKQGLVQKENEWTDAQLDYLKESYSGVQYSEDLPLDKVSQFIGKLKSNVCRKARQLGLTNINREHKKKKKLRIPIFSSKEELSKHVSQRMKKWYEENDHPRGTLGMKHTEETKIKISIANKTYFENAPAWKIEDAILKAAKTRVRNGTQPTMNRATASWGCGWRVIGGIRKYYRSKWEANYARYLEWLKSKGEIQGWLHEPETFWFDGIKRGCLSYLPDFRVVEKNVIRQPFIQRIVRVVNIYSHTCFVAGRWRTLSTILRPESAVSLAGYL